MKKFYESCPWINYCLSYFKSCGSCNEIEMYDTHIGLSMRNDYEKIFSGKPECGNKFCLICKPMEKHQEFMRMNRQDLEKYIEYLRNCHRTNYAIRMKNDQLISEIISFMRKYNL